MHILKFIEIFEDRIDKTCKITINDKIFIVLETFSTLLQISNLE